MANKKFSDFTNQPSTASTFLVGYDGTTNVRIPVTDSLFQGGTFAINLDDTSANVTRQVYSGGFKTTFTVTHNLNTKDYVPAVIQLSYSEFVGVAIFASNSNKTQIVIAGDVPNNAYRLILKY